MSLPARLDTLAFRLRSRLRQAWLTQLGVQIGRDVVLHRGVEIATRRPPHGLGRVILGDGCELSAGSILHPYGGRIELAPRVFVGPQVVMYGHGGIEIGEHTLIAMHCRILSSEHTVPAAGALIREQPDLRKPTRIGRDVWLGAGVTVTGGVTIGDGCVVGAGAVVTKDLPPGSIAHGIPAVVHGRRASP